MVTAGPTTTPSTVHRSLRHGAVGQSGAGHADATLTTLSTVLESRRVTRYERWVKPVLDPLLAVMLIVVTAPVMALVAVTVLVVMGRPVLFKQARVGLDGREFAMFKFRTMRPDRRVASTHYTGPERRRTHKSAADPRHTATGRVLRKLSVDELPQLFNVVLGHMSIVGPRPELTQMTVDYTPRQRTRHLVKPGVTGLWQITERGNGVPLQECIDLDLEYISQLSCLRDVGILLRTPVALLRNKGVV